MILILYDNNILNDSQPILSLSVQLTLLLFAWFCFTSSYLPKLLIIKVCPLLFECQSTSVQTQTLSCECTHDKLQSGTPVHRKISWVYSMYLQTTTVCRTTIHYILFVKSYGESSLHAAHKGNSCKKQRCHSNGTNVDTLQTVAQPLIS